MINTKLLGILAAVPILTGFTPYSEDQRLYVGANRLTDWVDVGTIYVPDADGHCCVPCWSDPSPIVSIEPSAELALQHYRAYTIRKAKSVWHLTYFSPDPTDIGIVLLNSSKAARRCLAMRNRQSTR